jgi:hypothetical protein
MKRGHDCAKQSAIAGLRMEAPIQCFSRLLTRDYDMDEVTLPAGSRAARTKVLLPIILR